MVIFNDAGSDLKLHDKARHQRQLIQAAMCAHGTSRRQMNVKERDNAMHNKTSARYACLWIHETKATLKQFNIQRLCALDATSL